jgi:hypothetical protein
MGQHASRHVLRTPRCAEWTHSDGHVRRVGALSKGLVGAPQVQES